MAWGNPNAEIVVLGFSKGPTQADALASSPHNEIAYKRGRKAVGKIFAHLGLIPNAASDRLEKHVSSLISDRQGRFHFGSLIRCTVEQFDTKKNQWQGSGGGMLDNFVATSFGKEIAGNCSKRFLSDLPDATRLVVLFELGSKGNYVAAARSLIQSARGGLWKTINEVAYADEKVTFVHVEHFASQGALLPNWLGENNHERARLGVLAREAVESALVFPSM